MGVSNEIKVGFVIAYDWKYLLSSIPLIYSASDKITLALDKNRKTWSGNSFTIPVEFYEWVKKIDSNSKITIYEDSFYKEGLTAIQNDARHRTMLTDYMGKGGWHLQIDSDEYFLNFPDFVKYLNQLSLKKKYREESIGIFCNFITLFKKTEHGYLYVDEKDHHQTITIATRFPEHSQGRGIKNKEYHYSPFWVLHDSWARTEEELKYKLSNWGHSKDFDIESYFKMWKSIDEHNYHYIHDFHPFAKDFWIDLKLIRCDSSNLMSEFLNKKEFQPYTFNSRKKNSPLYQKYYRFKKRIAAKMQSLNNA